MILAAARFDSQQQRFYPNFVFSSFIACAMCSCCRLPPACG